MVVIITSLIMSKKDEKDKYLIMSMSKKDKKDRYLIMSMSKKDKKDKNLCGHQTSFS